MTQGIVFQVETTRVLAILAKEIYDSPLALLRENIQNAYDAVRMRLVPAGEGLQNGRIDVSLTPTQVSITDNGVGMTEEVLRSNFWRAGSSGKHSEGARAAGVVGTFGIGAMANFGVCDRLTVQTRALDSDTVLESTAQRETLKIAEECISLKAVDVQRDFGTTVTAYLSQEHQLSIQKAKEYIESYVAFLPVPVFFNGQLISGHTFEERLFSTQASRSFNPIDQREWHNAQCKGIFAISTDSNARILVNVSNVQIDNKPVEGRLLLLQSGGPLMGLRSSFGLAPIPAPGYYQFGGYADFTFLQPTAGREALSRDSIAQVGNIIQIAEHAASAAIGNSALSDRNTNFMQWAVANKQWAMAKQVTIHRFPDDADIPLGELGQPTQNVHYYSGTDKKIISTFSGDKATLLQISQINPRRSLQQQYVTQILRIPQVPDSAQILKVYEGRELQYAEVAVLIQIVRILRDDYLIPDAEAALADISHGVTVIARREQERVKIFISKDTKLIPPLIEVYDKAWDVFGSFMKDFVRTHIFPRVQDFVPSSTRSGVDSLRKLLERNRELYRYEETDRGDLEKLLDNYLSGNKSAFAAALKAASSAARTQTQRVHIGQVGTIEHVVPDVIQSPVVPTDTAQSEFTVSPPIIREDVDSDMKILTSGQKHPQLNNFIMLLGLSDRLVQSESDFFRVPHSTRILWGGHRVVYIFTEATGRLNLYYDIDLREPIPGDNTGGGVFPTTTVLTKKRIYVPVPDPLVKAFTVTQGPKEFYVRFDVIASDPTPTTQK